MPNQITRRRPIPLLLGLVVLFAFPVWAGDEAETSERPSFSGTWELNEEMSDDLREKMREMMGNRRGRMGGGMGRGGGMGGPPGGGMGRGGGGMGGGMGGPPGGGMGRRDGRGPAMEDGFERLEIVHQEPELMVRYASGREQVIYTDDREPTLSSVGNDIFEITGKWKKDQRLVVTKKRESGGKITETWEYVPTTEQLWVTVKLPARGPMPKIELLRVYNRSADDEEAAAEPLS